MNTREMEVRCCCQPQKLLGWLPVPDGVTVLCVVRFMISPIDAITLEVAKYSERRLSAEGWELVSHLALKSEETPIERLRLIPGFRESRYP